MDEEKDVLLGFVCCMEARCYDPTGYPACGMWIRYTQILNM